MDSVNKENVIRKYLGNGWENWFFYYFLLIYL